MMVFSHLRAIILPLVTLGVLYGCASMQQSAAKAPVEVIPTAAEEDASPHAVKKEYPVRPFGKDALYELLVGEVAGYRKQYDVALEKYINQSEKTRDPGVAARATRLAMFMKRDDIALRAALIWADVEPDSLEAHRYAADLLTKTGDLTKAIVHLERVKKLGGLASFSMIAYRAGNIDPRVRKGLLTALDTMLQTYPNDKELLFAKAVLLEHSGRLEESLAITDQLIGIESDINVVILRVSTLRKLGRADEALAMMASEVELSPQQRRLRVLYARLLFEENDLTGAREQYEAVLEKAPRDGDILYALALIGLEQQDDDQARTYLNLMLRYQLRPGEAHYYLGTIDEKQENLSSALRHYEQAGTGYEFLPSNARMVEIITRTEGLDDARAHLRIVRGKVPNRKTELYLLEAQLVADHLGDKASLDFVSQILEDDPNNVDFLYFRAMTGEKEDDLHLMEQDLRHILNLQPDNADAMNALGYTLADRTDRHVEALQLISRALEIKPNEAAFIDSIGWVHYRLKNYDMAIKYLKQALGMLPNDEVAAHLGEVLWTVGERDDAQRVWENGLEIAPDSEILKNIMQKFQREP